MKSTLAWALLAALLWSSAPRLHGDLLLQGDSNITITTSGPAADELHLAADPLRDYLLAVLGKDELSGSGAAVTFALHAEALAATSLPHQTLADLHDVDSFEITIQDTPQPTIHIRGKTVLATCFGVTRFLEDDLGVTWLFPGELGTVLPRQDAITLRPRTQRYRPAVVSRFYTGLGYGDPQRMPAFRQRHARTSPLYQQRHFFEAYDYFKSLRLHGLAMPSHNMINIFPADSTPREHPEIMPMTEQGQRYQPPPAQDGRPNDHQHWHPCYTHPDTVKIASQAARQALEQGGFCFSLGINDGLRQQCQCERCLQVGWPASYYQFVTQVAESVKDLYPPGMIGVLVYGDVRHPVDPLVLPDNVFVLVSGGSKLEDWSRRAKHLGRYDYFYGHGFTVPSFPLAAMKHNAAIYQRHHLQSLRAEAHPVWAFDAPKLYLHARLLWEPDADTDALLGRYCDAAFGPGGPAMKRFYLHWAAKADYLVKPGSDEPAPLCDMSRWRRAAAQFAPLSTQDFQVAAACLDEAAGQVATDAQRQRLDMVATHMAQTRAEFDIHHLVQRLYDSDSGLDLSKAFAELAALSAQRDAAQERIADHPQWRLAGAKTDRREDVSMDMQTRAGLITAIVRLRRDGRLQPSMLAGLPAEYLAYDADLLPRPITRLKVATKGTYWALPQAQARFKPMSVELREGNSYIARSDALNDRVEEGAMAGEFRQHWAMVLVPVEQKGRRLLHEVQMEATGRGGVLTLDLGSPFKAADGDGLPVQSTASFGDELTTIRRSLLVEAIGPKSPYFNQPFQLRTSALWAPGDEQAHCEVRITVTALELPSQEGQP